MALVEEVPVAAQPVERFLPILGEEAIREARDKAAAVRDRLAGRVVWNINSTAKGGGVAEMLRSLLAYARGLEIDTRWLVITGTDEFFQITKRIHHALHGSPGSGLPLGPEQRNIYEEVLRENALELSAVVRPRDFVILHDPQTAGLAPYLERLGAIVIWRCHIGANAPNEETDLGWAFLEPYIQTVPATVFTRRQYVPMCCNHSRAAIIPPSIDPFSPKNQELEESSVKAILVHTGLVSGSLQGEVPVFIRDDGSPGRVDHLAEVISLGPPPDWDQPLIVQVSRWDPLKDPVGVMQGFARMPVGCGDAHLVLAGPNVRAVADDPEGAAVFEEVTAAWHSLPHAIQGRVKLASLPMSDVEENGAIVNALQRHATIVVQKSLQEGFGLTVTEAMWKARPIVASAVGGINDQITNGEDGLLIEDPRDPDALAQALCRLLNDRDYAKRLGEKARENATERFLGTRHLIQYADLLTRVDVPPT